MGWWKVRLTMSTTKRNIMISISQPQKPDRAWLIV